MDPDNPKTRALQTLNKHLPDVVGKKTRPEDMERASGAF